MRGIQTIPIIFLYLNSSDLFYGQDIKGEGRKKEKREGGEENKQTLKEGKAQGRERRGKEGGREEKGIRASKASTNFSVLYVLFGLPARIHTQVMALLLIPRIRYS